jgi:hypothetical protein
VVVDADTASKPGFADDAYSLQDPGAERRLHEEKPVGRTASKSRSQATKPATLPARQFPFPISQLLLWHILSLGVFSLVWLSLLHGYLPRRQKDDPTAGRALGRLFIPIYNL